MSERRCRVCGGCVPPDPPGRTGGHETAVGFVCTDCIDRHAWAVLEEQEAEACEGERPLDQQLRATGATPLPGLE